MWEIIHAFRSRTYEKTARQISLQQTCNCSRYRRPQSGSFCQETVQRMGGGERRNCLVINKYPGNWLVRHRRRRRRVSCVVSRRRWAARRGSSSRAAVPPRWWTFTVPAAPTDTHVNLRRPTRLTTTITARSITRQRFRIRTLFGPAPVTRFPFYQHLSVELSSKFEPYNGQYGLQSLDTPTLATSCPN